LPLSSPRCRHHRSFVVVVIVVPSPCRCHRPVVVSIVRSSLKSFKLSVTKNEIEGEKLTNGPRDVKRRLLGFFCLPCLLLVVSPSSPVVPSSFCFRLVWWRRYCYLAVLSLDPFTPHEQSLVAVVGGVFAVP
jgi:hypothetical protein